MKLDQPQFVFLMRNLHVDNLEQKDDFMIAEIANGVTIVHDATDNSVKLNINDRHYTLESGRSDLQEIGTILLNNEVMNGDKRSFTKAVPFLQKYATEAKLPLDVKSR